MPANHTTERTRRARGKNTKKASTLLLERSAPRLSPLPLHATEVWGTLTVPMRVSLRPFVAASMQVLGRGYRMVTGNVAENSTPVANALSASQDIVYENKNDEGEQDPVITEQTVGTKNASSPVTKSGALVARRKPQNGRTTTSLSMSETTRAWIFSLAGLMTSVAPHWFPAVTMSKLSLQTLNRRRNSIVGSNLSVEGRSSQLAVAQQSYNRSNEAPTEQACGEQKLSKPRDTTAENREQSKPQGQLAQKTPQAATSYVLDGKGLLKVLKKFDFKKALCDSYENVSNVDGGQFLTDVTRCHWILNGKSYETAEMTKVLEKFRQSNHTDGLAGITTVANENYRMWWSDFRKKYPDRYLALKTFYEVLKSAEIKNPSMSLIDEIVTHCHQGGLSASLYFDVMLLFAEELNVSNRVRSNDSMVMFIEGEDLPLAPLFKGLVRGVEVIKENSFVITEDLTCSIPVVGYTTGLEHTVVTSLRYEVSTGKNGFVKFGKCSLKATITSPPNVEVKVECDTWYIKLIRWVTGLFRMVYNWLLGYKSKQCTSTATKNNFPLSVEREKNNFGQTVLNFEYSIPSVVARPSDFLCEKLTKVLKAELSHTQSPDSGASAPHTNDPPHVHAECDKSAQTSSEEVASNEEAQCKTTPTASNIAGPIIEPCAPPATSMRL